MTGVRWAPAALEDLNGIHAYLHERDPRAAQRVVAAIRDGSTRLGTFPLSGPRSAMPGCASCR